jgi:hypothetical protein
MNTQEKSGFFMTRSAYISVKEVVFIPKALFNTNALGFVTALPLTCILSP